MAGNYVRDSRQPDKASADANLVRERSSLSYHGPMTKMLDDAVAKVRALPEADQNIAAEFLLGFADPEAHRKQLSPEQVQEVEVAKEEARQGKFASDTKLKALWRRFGL
jgi:hypothetical protein